MEERSASHLYAVQPDQEYFDAGKTIDGRQVLMGLYCPEIVAIFFDASGNVIGHEARRLEFLRKSSVIVDGEPIEGMVGVYDIYDERIPARIVAWQEELGYRPDTIRVKRFFLEELGIGIEDYPAHFDEVLADPAESGAEKEQVRESMRLWDADGQFVLYWGNDYWLNEFGEVVSS